MCSSLCLKWQKTLDLIQSCMYFCNVSLGSILSTTNPKSREEFTKSFRIQDFGISPSRLHIRTGRHIYLIQPKEHVLKKVLRIYYMFANMASLNRWRRVRGFSKSILYFIEIMLMAYHHLRHFCLPTSLWRSWWYRPSNLCFSHFTLDISWDLAAQSSCASIPFLSQANRNSDEPIE